MSATRVLRLYHSGVVAEYRERERWLRRKHGYDVHLVCPPAWPEGGSVVAADSDPEVPVHVMAVRGRQHPILFWYATRPLRRLLRELQPHIVDLHEEPFSLAAAFALRAIRREAPAARVCIYTAQNIFKRYPPPFRQLEQRAFREAAAAYPCSTEAGEVLRSKGFAGALYVLPLGVSLTPEPSPERPDGPLRVGFLGRLESYKGADIAIRAFADATRDIDAILEIVGAGPQRPELEAAAASLGVRGRVRFPGAVSQEEALTRIRCYDVVLVPSLTTATWKEQFGRVPAQAFAAGTAVLASDSGSLPEVLADCGEIAQEGDVRDFAEKLNRLLRDPGRRAELESRGRKRAVDVLSWEKVADGCSEMYRTLLHEPSTDARDVSYLRL
jgi:glycosyltransferase involved in cell wall biosynthesis